MTAVRAANLLAEDLSPSVGPNGLIAEGPERMGSMIEEILEFTRGEQAALRPRPV
jgi:hypothetical protein